MHKSIPSRVVIDWVRLVIPYDYQEVPDSEFYYESEHHNKKAAGIPLPSSRTIIKRLFSLLAIDGENFTDFTFFQKMDSTAPYDTRYKRDGFDLRFNDLGNPAWVRELDPAHTKYMPVTRLEMGVKLDIQGQGCRYIEHALRRDGHDWRWLMYKLQHEFPKIHVRRIDVAYDIFKKTRHFNPIFIANKFEKEQKYRKYLSELTPKDRRKLADHKYVKTRKRKYAINTGGDLVTGDDTGFTFYLGSSSDETLLRIYDKDAERYYSHGDTWRRNGKNRKYWYRWEVQTTGSVAMKVFQAILDKNTGGEIWLNLIRRLFCILPTDHELKTGQTTKVPYKATIWSKVKMIDTPLWWADFIQYSDIDKLHFNVEKSKSDLKTTDKWLSGPVSHTMYVRLYRHMLQGGDVQQLLEHWLRQGGEQLNLSDIKDINAQLDLLAIPKKFKKSGKTEEDWIQDANEYFEDYLERRIEEEMLFKMKRDIKHFYVDDPSYKPFNLQKYFDWFNGIPAKDYVELQKLEGSY